MSRTQLFTLFVRPRRDRVTMFRSLTRSLLPVAGIALLPIAAAHRPAEAQWLPATDPPAAAVILPGDVLDERERTAQLRGDELGGYLLRTPSSRGETAPGFRLVLPRLDLARNSELPFSLNDGSLWAGRGLSGRLAAGVEARYGPVRARLVPEITYSENLPFQIARSTVLGRSVFASPWHTGERFSADLPLRFGDRSLVRVHPGQSMVEAEAGGAAFGFSTENQWWGPGIRSALVMSDNAPGVPHLYLRSRTPLQTRWGAFEGRWIAGWLSDSPHFEEEPELAMRSLSGVVATFRPAAEPGLTLGLARAVYGGIGNEWEGLARAADVVTRWERADTAAAPGSATEQITSLFARWVFPASGFEAYAEWARAERPRSVTDFLLHPHHSQAYTLGLQAARPIHSGLLRLQGEVTYLEESATFAARPVPRLYLSRTVPQGYTHRGRVIGAATGPGSSAQWLAADYLADAWQAGLYAGRIRWENDAYYDDSRRSYLAHDVSILTGARGGVRLWSVHFQAEVGVERRLNYLFQNPEINPDAPGAVDHWNTHLRFGIMPLARDR
jgi:hypothetical protein